MPYQSTRVSGRSDGERGYIIFVKSCVKQDFLFRTSALSFTERPVVDVPVDSYHLQCIVFSSGAGTGSGGEERQDEILTSKKNTAEMQEGMGVKDQNRRK